MKTKMANVVKGFLMMTAAVSMGCVDAGDLGAFGSTSSSPDTAGAAPTGHSSAAIVTATQLHIGQTNRVRLPFDPSRVPFACDPTGSSSALVQTGNAASVDVPHAVSYRYRIDTTATVYVAAYVRNVCGAHYGRFDFYGPDGQLYTRRPATFVADGDGTGARRVGDGYVIEAALPIAGTDIAGLPMTGTWSVNFVLDGQSHALGLGLFELYN